MNGAGASGIAISHMLLEAGVRAENMNTIDRAGTIYSGRGAMDPYKEELAHELNPKKEALTIEDAVNGIDILVGASSAGAFTQDMVRSMNDDAIVFAIANPTPEIYPELAHEAGALIVGTGRSDFANQINNVLGFPGIFRGILDVRASEVTRSMKVAAAHAIASMTSDEELSPSKIITTPVDPKLMATEAAAVAEAAMRDNVARLERSPSEIYDMTCERVEFYKKYHGKLVETRNQLRTL
jgi:malate dehydrogenase (oxaloacetate-decarboxylating)